MTVTFGDPYVSTPTSPSYEDTEFDVPAETPYVYQQIELGGGGTDPGDGDCDPRPTTGMIYPRRLPVSGR